MTEAIATPAAPATSAVDPNAAPAAAPVSAPSPAAAATPAAPAESAEEQQKKGFQKRIDAKTREVWEERRARQTAEAEAQILREQLAAAKAASAPAAAATPPPASAPVAPAAGPALDAMVNERASQLARERDFSAKCNDIYNAGKKELADFDAAIQGFNVFGGLGAHRGMLEAVTALPDSHKILHHLGSNLDETGRILALPPVQQAIELTRLSAQLKSNPVSGAPAPINPVGTGTPNPTPGPDDKGDFKSQEDYKAWRARHFKKK